jgi:hypothetical protein
MKALENCITLASKVTIYVPATVNTTKTASNAKQVKAAAELLAQLFGGATSSAAVGYWVSESAGLVKEKTTVVFAYCTEEALDKGIENVVSFCRTLKADMSQEAIALEVNGSMYFI